MAKKNNDKSYLDNLNNPVMDFITIRNNQQNRKLTREEQELLEKGIELKDTRAYLVLRGSLKNRAMLYAKKYRLSFNELVARALEEYLDKGEADGKD